MRLPAGQDTPGPALPIVEPRSSRSSPDGIHGLWVELQLGRRQILPEVRQRRRTGDQQQAWRLPQQPGQGHLGGRDSEPQGSGDNGLRCQHGLAGLERRAEREERYIGNLVCCAGVQQSLVGPAGRLNAFCTQATSVLTVPAKPRPALQAVLRLCTVDIVPVDPELLTAAHAAETRMVDAEHAADLARAEFRHAVRRLHLAGGSLREIADVLNLSHQRVHQIIEEAGGARPWRLVLRSRGLAARADLACSFCGKQQPQVRKVIAGPRVYICDQCTSKAQRVIATGQAADTPLSAVRAIGEDITTAKCSFCGKRRYQVPGLAAAARAAICTECLALCHEITAEQLT